MNLMINCAPVKMKIWGRQNQNLRLPNLKIGRQGDTHTARRHGPILFHTISIIVVGHAWQRAVALWVSLFWLNICDKKLWSHACFFCFRCSKEPIALVWQNMTSPLFSNPPPPSCSDFSSQSRDKLHDKQVANKLLKPSSYASEMEDQPFPWEF